MFKIVLSCGVAIASAAALSSPSALAASLGELPQCSHDEGRLDISGLPRTLVAGREALLTLDDYLLTSRDTSVPYHIEQTLNGQRASALEISGSRLRVRPSNPGNWALAVTYATEEGYDTYEMAPIPPCQMTTRWTRRVVKPSPQKVRTTVTVPRYLEHVEFIIQSDARRAEDCDYSHVRVPVTVAILSGKWSVKRSAANACTGWDGRRDERAVSAYSDTLRFSPFATSGWPRKASATRTYRYTIRSGRKVTGRGAIVARAAYVPVERVYASLPGGEINDDYWNYCVKNGEEITMDHGNPYCTWGGYHERTIKLTRR